MTLGEKIRFRRKQLGMTQEELGKKLNTTKQTIGKYENGTVTNLPLRRVQELANALDMDSAYLMGWDNLEEKVEDLSAVKQAFIEEIKKMPDEKVNALIQMMRAFKEI